MITLTRMKLIVSVSEMTEDWAEIYEEVIHDFELLMSLLENGLMTIDAVGIGVLNDLLEEQFKPGSIEYLEAEDRLNKQITIFRRG